MQLEPPLIRRDIGDIGQPDCIGHSDTELAFKKIGHRAFRDVKATMLKLSMDPRRAIALLALQEDCLDLGAKTVAPSNALGPPGRGTHQRKTLHVILFGLLPCPDPLLDAFSQPIEIRDQTIQGRLDRLTVNIRHGLANGQSLPCPRSITILRTEIAG